MAVGESLLLASGTGVDGVSATTASITTTSEPVFAWISIAKTPTGTEDPSEPTLAGGGKTSWTLVESQAWRAGATTGALFLFLGTGAGGAAVVTITKNAADSTLTGYAWVFEQLTGVAASPVLQTAKAQDLDFDLADTLTATLGNAPVATSRCWAGSVVNVSTASSVPKTGWTEIADNPIASPSHDLMVQWSDTTDQSASVTQTSGNNAQGGLIVVEVGVLLIVPKSFIVVTGV